MLMVYYFFVILCHSCKICKIYLSCISISALLFLLLFFLPALLFYMFISSDLFFVDVDFYLFFSVFFFSVMRLLDLLMSIGS